MHTYINCGRDGWQGSQSYAFLCGFLSGHGGVIRAHRGEGEIKGAWLAGGAAGGLRSKNTLIFATCGAYCGKRASAAP